MLLDIDGLKFDKIQNWNEAYSKHYFMYRTRNLFNSISGLKPVFIVYKM